MAEGWVAPERRRWCHRVQKSSVLEDDAPQPDEEAEEVADEEALEEEQLREDARGVEERSRSMDDDS